MSDFFKVFALLSGITFCVIAGLFVVGFTYGVLVAVMALAAIILAAVVLLIIAVVAEEMT